MAQQQEYGTQFPMRPVTATLSCDGAYNLSNDTGAVGWTTAAYKIPLQTVDVMMDDHNAVSIATNLMTLKAGIWEIDFSPTVTNGEVDQQDVRMAITNGSGSSIYFESDDFTVEANSITKLSFPQLLHLTSDQEIALRIVHNSTGSTGELTMADDAAAGMVRKIGNVNES